MAKKRKPKPPPNVVELQTHREWLIRCVLIGLGYVRRAQEVTQDAYAHKFYARQEAEMQKCIDGTRPAAEDVLKMLGKRVHEHVEAFAKIRDIVLEQRDQIEGEGFTNDQINAVLSVIDDHTPPMPDVPTKDPEFGI